MVRDGKKKTAEIILQQYWILATRQTFTTSHAQDALEGLRYQQSIETRSKRLTVQFPRPG